MYYIIEICLLSLRSSITRNGVFYKDLYKGAPLKDFYNVEWFVQRWMICIRWIMCPMLNDLHNAFNVLYFVEWFELNWMICTLLNDL